MPGAEYTMRHRFIFAVVAAAAAVDDDDDDDDANDNDEGQHQLTTFNHQSRVLVGGKTDDSGNAAHQFHGTISGTTDSDMPFSPSRAENTLQNNNDNEN